MDHSEPTAASNPLGEVNRRFVVVDRDGTMNVKGDYISSPDQLQLLPRTAAGLRPWAKWAGVGRDYEPVRHRTRLLRPGPTGCDSRPLAETLSPRRHGVGSHLCLPAHCQGRLRVVASRGRSCCNGRRPIGLSPGGMLCRGRQAVDVEFGKAMGATASSCGPAIAPATRRPETVRPLCRRRPFRGRVADRPENLSPSPRHGERGDRVPRRAADE